MNGLKKALLMAFCLLAAQQAFAFKPPLDKDGVRPQSIEDVGVFALTLRYTQTPSVVMGASIAVHGVLTSSAPDLAYLSITSAAVEVRTSSTAVGTLNKNSELLFPPVPFTSTQANTFIWFDVPFIAHNGISASLTSTGVIATVFYQFLSTNADSTAYEYTIPRDDRDGEKTYSPSLFGAKVATSATTNGTEGDRTGNDALDYRSDVVSIEQQRSFLYGTMASSGAANNFALFYSSNSALGSYTTLHLPPLLYNTIDGDFNTKAASYFKFPAPIIFPDGIRMQSGQATDRFRAITRPTRRTY